jgi:uncharacterized beta-barrel protein YwiB (DUF1934 family)
MKKNVDVMVTGIHSRLGEPTEKITTQTSGTYEELEDCSSVLEYDEEQDTGAGMLKIHSRVMISPDGKGMEIVRGGEMKSKLAFANGLEYDTEYNTPYGSMQMKVITKSFDLTRAHQDEGMKLVAEYALEMGGQVLSDSMIVIEIKSA